MKQQKIVILLLLIACLAPAQAQRRAYYNRLMPQQQQDTLFSKWEPHLAVSTGFVGTTQGDNRLFTTVAPSVDYHASDRLTLYAGFAITSDLGLNPNYNVGRSYAPRRNGGTGVAAVEAGGEYQLNDRVWLAASVWHAGGEYAPLWGPANGSTMDVSATAVSAAAAFRFRNDNLLHISFTYVRDHAGTLPWLYHDACMHSGWGWGGCAGPMYSPWGF